MHVIDIIIKKRDGIELTEDEIDFVIKNYIKGDIPDYQMSSFLMAIYFNGMTYKETSFLTRSMIESGDKIDLSDVSDKKIDKHSTGGVGDKVSLIVAPMVASCGIKVPMISGRGLGHTGGTLDKLESIPGFRVNLPAEEFKEYVKKSNVSIMGQTEEIVPADRKIYALRDVTGTVPSIPLISSSIISKKAAAGIDGLVMDIKLGNGAFISNYSKAKELADNLINLGRHIGIDTVAVITDMNQPLGKAVGNSIEVIESIKTLRGYGPEDLLEVSMTIGAWMILLGKRSMNLEEARRMLKETIMSGKALNKFKEMVENQGGNPEVIEDESLLPAAEYIEPVISDKEGIISEIQTTEIGKICMILGAGRENINSIIEHSAGIYIEKKIGEEIRKGEILCYINTNYKKVIPEAKERILNAYKTGEGMLIKPPLVYSTIY